MPAPINQYCSHLFFSFTSLHCGVDIINLNCWQESVVMHCIRAFCYSHLQYLHSYPGCHVWKLAYIASILGIIVWIYSRTLKMVCAARVNTARRINMLYVTSKKYIKSRAWRICAKKPLFSKEQNSLFFPVTYPDISSILF